MAYLVTLASGRRTFVTVPVHDETPCVHCTEPMEGGERGWIENPATESGWTCARCGHDPKESSAAEPNVYAADGVLYCGECGRELDDCNAAGRCRQ